LVIIHQFAQKYSVGQFAPNLVQS